MGVNAVIECRGQMTDDEFRRVRALMVRTIGKQAFYIETAPGVCPIVMRDGKGHHGLMWKDADKEVAEVMTLQRFYGPNYPRGDWPLIRAMLVFLRRYFADVRYGGDTGSELSVVTDDLLVCVDSYWVEHGNDEYYERDSEVMCEFCQAPADGYTCNSCGGQREEVKARR